MGHAALDGHAGRPDLVERVGVVRLGVDRLGEVLADLVLVDVEGRDEVDVADVVAAQIDVHQARDEVVGVRVLVVVAALDEAAGAVPDPDDGDPDLAVAAAPGARPGVRWRRPVLAVAVGSVLAHVFVSVGFRGGLAQRLAADVEDALDAVMVAPTAMIGEGDEEDRCAGTAAVETDEGMPHGDRTPKMPARIEPRERMTSRISRGISPTAAMPVPSVKPRPSDLARA